MTSRAPNTSRSRDATSRRELLAGALVVALFAFVFLWTPIWRTNAVLVPAELGQSSTWTHVDVPADATPTAGADSTKAGAAEVVADAWSRYAPWSLYSRGAIRDGRLPLWNDLSGAGAPHFANLEAGVLSPFALPWYVLDVRAAALVSAFARLFALGFFAYLFLREMRVAFFAAIVGSIVFQFAGVNVIGLFTPASAAAVLAPAGLYVIERMARATERAIADPEHASRLRPGMGSAAALAVIIAGAFLSGGFATFLFALLLVAAYAAARFIRIGTRSDDPAREVSRASTRALAALAVGTCLSAVQFLPWVEELDHVVPTSTLAAASEPLSSDALALDVFPDMLGTPDGAFQLSVPPTSDQPSTDRARPPDRHVVIAEHVGSIALFLALLGLFFARRRRAAVFFALAAITWFAAAHGWLGRTLLAIWPGGSIAPIAHGQVVFALSIAVLAAFALDRIVVARRPGEARIAFAVLVAGAGCVWMLRSSADSLATAALVTVPEPQRAFAAMSSNAHVEVVSAVFCAGLLCVALALAIRPGRARSLLVLGVGVAVFAETGWMTSDLNVLALQSTVYPRTNAIEQLTRIARGKEVLVLGNDRIPPDTHLVYGLRQLSAHDPVRTQRFDRLLLAQFGVDGDVITHAGERALRLFGVDIVLEKNRWSDAKIASGRTSSPGMSFASAEILPDMPFVQRFVDRHGKQGPLRFEWVTNGSHNECTLRVTLFDADTRERILQAVYGPGDLRPHGQTRMPCAIEVPEAEQRSGRKLVLKISSDDAVAGRSWSVLCRGASGIEDETHAHDPADWIAMQGGRVIAGRLALQPDDDPSTLEIAEQIGAFAARTCADSGRFRTVSAAYPAGGEEDAWRTVMRAGFDPRSIVVLEGVAAKDTDPHAAPDGSAHVDVVQERANFIVLHTHRARDGWLVAAIAWYPGWRAYVNGVAVPVHCANYAFTALALPAGENTVELVLEPTSVRTGTVITCMGLLLLSGMMVAAFANMRSRA